MALNRKHSPELEALLKEQAEMQARLEAAEQAQRAADEAADRAAKKALRVNGLGYARLVLDLCDELGIEPEHTRTRTTASGRQSEVSTDPGDELRLGRLREMLAQIIAATDSELLDELKLADAAGRDQRRDEREHAKRRAEPEPDADDDIPEVADEEEPSAADEDAPSKEPALPGPGWR